MTSETKLTVEAEILLFLTARFTYTNYKGETEQRRAFFRRIVFGSTPWHPEPQWLVAAFDMDRNATRTFALKDIDPTTLKYESN